MDKVDGKGCHLDLPATEMCSKSEWILYSESLVVWVELQMILSFIAKVNKSMISIYSTSLTQHGTITYSSAQTSSSLKSGKMQMVGQDGHHCWWRHRPPPARTLRLKSRRTDSCVPAKNQDMDSTTGEGRGEWAAVQQCKDSWWV